MTAIRNALRPLLVAAALAVVPAFAAAQDADAPAAAAPDAEAPAQEISASHMAAALDAVTSSRTAQQFDTVLPTVAEKVQAQLIAMRPDMYQQIADIVQAEALELVARRPELNNDIARIWAQNFSEEELTAIATFYKSPAGVKLTTVGPQVVAQSLIAVRAWSDRIGADLLDAAKAEMARQGIELP